MARPNTKQIAERKQAAKEARAFERLERLYREAPFKYVADFAVVECENCGQEQTTWTFGESGAGDEWGSPCIVCGHLMSRTAASHDHFVGELAELALAASCS